MKKILSLVMAAVLALTVSVCVFAAGSNVGSASIVSGGQTLSSISSTVVSDVQSKAAATGSSVVFCWDVKGSTTVSFDLSSVAKVGDQYQIWHAADGTNWVDESNGTLTSTTLTYTFGSLSPVAIAIIPASTSSTSHSGSESYTVCEACGYHDWVNGVCAHCGHVQAVSGTTNAVGTAASAGAVSPKTGELAYLFG